MTEEMLKRLGEVVRIAPWTELDLSCNEKVIYIKGKKARRKWGI